jgi:hypothetical protein
MKGSERIFPTDINELLRSPSLFSAGRGTFSADPTYTQSTALPREVEEALSKCQNLQVAQPEQNQVS